MIQFLPAVAEKVLDVGCGEGNFGIAVKKQLNCEIWGIEINQRAAKVASAKYDRVLVGDIFEVLPELPLEYFDCIVFNDILEHLENPCEALRLIKVYLNHEGVVICSIPNIRHYRTFFKLVFKKQWRYENQGVMDKTHLRFFTEKTIREMFNMLDYNILKIKGLNRSRRWKIRLISRLSLGWLSDTVYLQYGCKVKPRAKINPAHHYSVTDIPVPCPKEFRT